MSSVTTSACPFAAAMWSGAQLSDFLSALRPPSASTASSVPRPPFWAAIYTAEAPESVTSTVYSKK